MRKVGRVTNPADGERRAVVGLSAQYRVAAALVYRQILNGRLEFIRLADPEAERVDDVQIATRGCLDAYQVKWSSKPSTITFKDLTRPDGDKPPLIAQLASGWKKLSASNPDRRVRVHLVARDYASTNDSLGSTPDDKSVGTFYDLWINVLQPFSKGQLTKGEIPARFLDAVEQIRTVGNLSDGELAEFLSSCSFNLMYQDATPEDELGEDEGKQRDLKELAQLFQRIVAADRRIVEVSFQRLLELLGWDKKLKHRFRHEFWVDERIYQPIEGTARAIEEAIDSRQSGYIALIGGPGTGKSTTLTQTLRYKRGLRVVRYYAYVRDDPSPDRGEALSFLHDIYVELRAQGITSSGKIPETADDFSRAFSDQLVALGTEFREREVKTLILVDGLDHIEREQKPQRSLICQLPLPSQIPNGVLFVLGTQKIELRDLSDAIKAHLSETGRTIEMAPLSRPATIAMLELADLQYSLTAEQREGFWQVSAGHPLATTYLVERLRQAKSVQEAESLLDSSVAFTGEIERTYQTHWLSCKDPALRDLLGLVCRLRVPIDIGQLAQW